METTAVLLPDPYSEPLVSIARAGVPFGLGRSASYNAADNGTLPTIVVNGRRRVRTVDIYDKLGLPLPSRHEAIPTVDGA